MDVIKFYAARGECGAFSNFAPYSVRLKRKTWPTAEHYYQAQKFAGMPHEHEIRKAKSPGTAARMGRDRTRGLRRDWDRVRTSVMYDAVKAKFTQHDELRELLLSTGDAKLVEHTARDAYWGDGGDGRGRNMLGQILMRVREELRRYQHPPHFDVTLLLDLVNSDRLRSFYHISGDRDPAPRPNRRSLRLRCPGKQSDE